MSKYDNLPVIVQQLIENLNDKGASVWTRDNYCSVLERIRSACDTEITKFQKEKTKLLEKKKVKV
jgi:hypothetical protein